MGFVIVTPFKVRVARIPIRTHMRQLRWVVIDLRRCRRFQRDRPYVTVEELRRAGVYQWSSCANTPVITPPYRSSSNDAISLVILTYSISNTSRMNTGGLRIHHTVHPDPQYRVAYRGVPVIRVSYCMPLTVIDCGLAITNSCRFSGTNSCVLVV